MQEELVVENLNIEASFLKGTRKIVSDISFCIKQGESLAIVGESGSGKTMTALSLLDLLPENCEARGSALFNGVQLIGSKNAKKARGKDIMFIPHSGLEFLNPSLKIKTQMFESMRINGLTDRKKMRAEAIKNLELVGIEDQERTLEKYPFELSGGQAQRVLIAIAMCANPKLLIADEATKGVDERTADDIWQLMISKFFGACKIFITHNIEFAMRCDKILVLKDGIVQESGNAKEVLQNPKSDYTKLLLEVMPKERGQLCC